jgi:hypothetical protein
MYIKIHINMYKINIKFEIMGKGQKAINKREK